MILRQSAWIGKCFFAHSTTAMLKKNIFKSFSWICMKIATNTLAYCKINWNKSMIVRQSARIWKCFFAHSTSAMLKKHFKSFSWLCKKITTNTLAYCKINWNKSMIYRQSARIWKCFFAHSTSEIFKKFKVLVGDVRR